MIWKSYKIIIGNFHRLIHIQIHALRNYFQIKRLFQSLLKKERELFENCAINEKPENSVNQSSQIMFHVCNFLIFFSKKSEMLNFIAVFGYSKKNSLPQSLWVVWVESFSILGFLLEAWGCNISAIFSSALFWISWIVVLGFCWSHFLCLWVTISFSSF